MCFCFLFKHYKLDFADLMGASLAPLQFPHARVRSCKLLGIFTQYICL